MKTIVIYPGRFQPMLSHHAEVYRQLTQTFPDAEVYIGTSDKVEPGKSPFNFKEKQQIAQAHGIDASKVLPAKVPYVNASYTQFNQDEVSVIFAVGEKDYQERFAPKNIDPKTGIDTKKNGDPYYYQMINSYKNNPMPMSKRGYIYVAPNISSENEIASASAFRQAIIDSPDKEAAKEIVDKQFKVYSNDLFNLLYNKIAGNKMSEELNIIKKLAGLEVTEAAPVEFETVADPKAVSFLDAGKSSSKMSIANRFPEGSDVNDPEVKKEQFLQALIKSPEALLMEINERIDPKDENNAAVQTKLTAIIDGMKENGLAGLNDEDRQFVVVLTSQAIKNMTLVAGDDSPDYDGEPPVKSFDFEGINLLDEPINEYEEPEPGSYTRFFLKQDFTQMSKQRASDIVGEIASEVFPTYDMHEDPLDGALDELHDLLDGETMSGYEFDQGEMDYPNTSEFYLSDSDYKDLPRIQQIVRAKYIERMNDPEIQHILKHEYNNYTDDQPQELPGMTVPQESIEEGKMKEIIQDLKDMDKKEFCSTYPEHADEYENLCKQYDDDAQNEPQESFDPAMEPSEEDTMFSNAYEIYDDKGEEALAEYLGMSHREFDQELTEFCIEHGLHMDDDRDMAIQGMIEMIIDQRDLDEDQKGVCPKCGEKKHILKACASCGCSEGVEEEAEEIEEWAFAAAPVSAAIWTGARKLAVPLAQASWGVMKGVSGFIWKNKGSAAVTGVALTYQEEIKVATEFLSGIGEKIEPVLKLAKQWGLPVLAVIAVVYGGKKIHDMIKGDDMEPVAEENVLEQALVELKKLAGI